MERVNHPIWIFESNGPFSFSTPPRACCRMDFAVPVEKSTMKIHNSSHLTFFVLNFLGKLVLTNSHCKNLTSRIYQWSRQSLICVNYCPRLYMGVSDHTKWLVYNGHPIKMDDLAVPPISGNLHHDLETIVAMTHPTWRPNTKAQRVKYHYDFFARYRSDSSNSTKEHPFLYMYIHIYIYSVIHM